ncbi:hypothetical protein [Roseiconus lacunae]|uniref:XRE family transcriptional regulator n=1 Tax=Roseiconus lacunae TaxID=2605694 RepID=A0ABT7PFK9_9BACT|nr:hypothetical protein [Roseiconus lacunae]MDM4015280.1 hypothetical protein [Roseiconus lacunae]
MIAFDAEAHIFPSSYEALRQEAASLVNRLGWTAEDACRLVGIEPQSWLPVREPRLPFTPTPMELLAAIDEIRGGGVNPDGTGYRRRQRERDLRAWNDDIDEDRLTMPEWFRG